MLRLNQVIIVTVKGLIICSVLSLYVLFYRSGNDPDWLCTCTAPVRRVFFSKTHKTASTTTHSIFARFSVKYDLITASPIVNSNDMWWPARFKPRAIWNYKSLQKFNISLEMMMHHLVYDREYINQVFPRNNTFYITIIREPFSQLKSTIATFLSSLPRKQLSKYVTDGGSDRIWHMRFGGPRERVTLLHNFMSFDLGYPIDNFNDEEAFQEYLQLLNNDFDLVLITEYYVESVVLMRRMLCWSFLDVLWVRQNENRRRDEKVNIRFISDNIADAKVRHRQRSKLDYQLYEYFNRTLWEKIAKMPPDYQREVEYLRKTQKVIETFCHAESVISPGRSGHKAEEEKNLETKFFKSEWHDEFILNLNLCKLLAVTDKTWIPLIRRSLTEKMQRLFGDEWTKHASDEKIFERHPAEHSKSLVQIRELLNKL